MKNWNYRNGSYFITINTKGKIDYFGYIEKGQVILSKLGLIAKKCWRDIPKHFSNVILDGYIIMPDHVHGILHLEEDKSHVVGVANRGMNTENKSHVVGVANRDMNAGNKSHVVGVADLRPLPPTASKARPLPPTASQRLPPKDRAKMPLPKIIHGYKSSVSRKINKEVGYKILLWQRSYYDKQIKNKRELIHYRNYIKNNSHNL